VNVFIVSAFGGQKPQFLANFDIFGAAITFTDEGQISSRSVYSVALWRRKTPILLFLGLRHLVLSPLVSSLRKLNMGAQLQTFPYPKESKSFLYSNAFMAKSGAQSLTFKSVKDKQTSRQTKNSTFLATPAAGEIRAPPNLARQ